MTAMKSRNCETGRSPVGRTALILAAATAIGSLPARAANTTYVGASGSDWNNAANWNGGIPATGSTAVIGETPSSLFTVNFDGNYTSATAINELVLETTGGTQPVQFNQTSFNNLFSGGELIGLVGSCIYNHTDGLNSISGGLVVASTAGSTATYSLSSLGTLSVGSFEDIGAGGNGTFLDAGITNTAPSLILGQSSGSKGSFTLSSGTATFTGTVTVGGIGAGAAVGSLLITGGTFTAATLTVGNTPGTGVTLQGGSLSVAAVSFASGSFFSFSGGTLNITAPLSIDSTNFGPTLDLNSGDVLQGTTLTNNSTINMNAATISVSGQLINNLQINTSGVIAGAGALVNNSIITLNGSGNLTISAAGANSNGSNGSINLLAADQLQLTGGSFSNSGIINLNQGQITGSATLTNNGLISGPGAISAPMVNNGAIAITSGSLDLPNVTNDGAIDIAGITAVVTGSFLTNNSTIQGYGTIANPVINSGTIEATGNGVLQFNMPMTENGLLSASTGNKILLMQGVNTTASSVISLTGGTFDTNNMAFTNVGQITGYGTIRTGGLTNNGAITLTGGTTTVNGPVTNSSGQTINIKYQPAIFTGNVTNNGTIKTTNTTVTFTGTYSGNAFISDPSTNIFQNNVTVVPGGQMTGSTGDQYYMSGGTFSNQGTYTNTGFLQSSDPTINSGTFTQGGTQNWSPGTVFTNTAGMATFQTDAGSASAYDLSVNVTGGSVAITSPQHLASLTVSGNGTFDVNNNHVIINYGAGPDPIASIAAMLATGYAGGAWNGAGGIVSSVAAANSGGYGLGYADSADPGNPAGLASGTIEVKFTLLGDADLNGTVNGVDFGILAANFNHAVSRWDQGDFSYDNIVNGVDFADLAANFNKGGSGASVGGSALSDPALVAFAEANGLMADVPEPSGIGLLLAAASCSFIHRRRKAFPASI